MKNWLAGWLAGPNSEMDDERAPLEIIFIYIYEPRSRSDKRYLFTAGVLGETRGDHATAILYLSSPGLRYRSPPPSFWHLAFADKLRPGPFFLFFLEHEISRDLARE